MVDWVSLLKRLPQNKEQLQPYLISGHEEFNGFLSREYPCLPEDLRRELERNLATRKGTRFLDLLQAYPRAAVRTWAVELAEFLPAELRIPRLLIALGDKNDEVKLLASAGLGKLSSADVARRLVEGLAEGKWLPARVAQVLSSIAEISLPYVANLASSADEKLRLYAVDIFEQINTEQAGQEMLKLLGDSSGQVRKRASTALLSFSGINSGEALLEGLRREHDLELKIHLMKLLGRIRYGPAREILEAQLGSGNPKLERAASAALEHVH